MPQGVIFSDGLGLGGYALNFWGTTMDRNTAVMTWREVCGSDAVMAGLPPTGRMLEEFARRIETAERERLMVDADEWGNALNAASWALTAAYRKHTGEVDPVIFSNHAKGILRDGIAAYFEALKVKF